MATSTANTILKFSTTQTGTYSKLIDIIDFPDLGGEPEKLDTTTLTATKFKTNILGLMDLPTLSFSANYEKADLATITALAGDELWFHLEFGDSGADGKFEWKGQVMAYVTGGGVNEVRKLKVICSAETEIDAI